MMIQKSLLDLLCYFVCFDLATPLWYFSWLKLAHCVTRSDSTVLWQTRFCTIICLEFSSTCYGFITIPASDWGTTTTTTKWRWKTVSWKRVSCFNSLMNLGHTNSRAWLRRSCIPHRAAPIITAQVNAWFPIRICQDVNISVIASSIFCVIIFIYRPLLFTLNLCITGFTFRRGSITCSSK